MAKKTKKTMTIRQPAMDPILAYAYPEKGGIFGENAFDRAMAAGQDPVAQQMAILEALKNADQFGVQVDPNFQWLANGGFDELLNEYRTNTAGSPKTAINPNLQNIPLLQYRPADFNNPYRNGAKFTPSEGVKRGFGLVGGYGNVQDMRNEAYWQTQIDSNPEVNYRWNTGDSLDPGRDANNSYGILAGADLNGTSMSPDMVKLARDRAAAYERGTPMDNWTGSTYLNEKDPRYAAVNQGGKAAIDYMYSLDPNRGSSDAYKRLNAALNEGALDVMPENAAQTSTGGTATTGTSGATDGSAAMNPMKSRLQQIRNAENFGQALRIAGSNDRNIGKKEAKAISKATGRSTEQIFNRVDKANDKWANKRGFLGIKANLANSYYKKNQPFGAFNTKLGDGAIASSIRGMFDRTTVPGMAMNTGVRSQTTKGTGKLPKGTALWGNYAGTPQLREAFSTKGQGWGRPMSNTNTQPITNPDPVSTNTDGPTGFGEGGGGGGDFGGDMGASLSAATGGMGGNINSTATGFRMNKGKRFKAGPMAQGYKSQLTAPFNKAGVGVNPGPWSSGYKFA
jgi:hypothetical protein